MHYFFKTKKTIFTLLMSLLFITNSATALNCGDVIMTDTVMTEDLHCFGTGPSGIYAIEFGSDNITLDMNGYIITGDGGILSNVTLGFDQRNNITIKNGSIIDSSVAIGVTHSSNIHIQNMTFYNVNLYGIFSEDSEEVYIEKSDFYYTYRGIFIGNNFASQSFATIKNNQFYKNSTAIDLFKSSKNIITGNFVWKSTIDGISLMSSDNNSIWRNEVIETENTALKLTNSSDNDITGNKLDYSYTGFSILASTDTCTGCNIKSTGNVFNGNYSMHSKIGVDLGGLPVASYVSFNSVKGNKIYYNETGIYFHSDASYNSTHNGFQGTATPVIDEGTGNSY